MNETPRYEGHVHALYPPTRLFSIFILKSVSLLFASNHVAKYVNCAALLPCGVICDQISIWAHCSQNSIFLFSHSHFTKKGTCSRISSRSASSNFQHFSFCFLCLWSPCHLFKYFFFPMMCVHSSTFIVPSFSFYSPFSLSRRVGVLHLSTSIL